MFTFDQAFINTIYCPAGVINTGPFIDVKLKQKVWKEKYWCCWMLVLQRHLRTLRRTRNTNKGIFDKVKSNHLLDTNDQIEAIYSHLSVLNHVLFYTFLFCSSTYLNNNNLKILQQIIISLHQFVSLSPIDLYVRNRSAVKTQYISIAVYCTSDQTVTCSSSLVGWK